MRRREVVVGVEGIGEGVVRRSFLLMVQHVRGSRGRVMRRIVLVRIEWVIVKVGGGRGSGFGDGGVRP